MAATLSTALAQKPALPPMAEIEAGAFRMGSDGGAGWEKPAHRVQTPRFKIAARPVSNAAFALFKPGHVSPGDRSGPAPVTGVSWQDAADYCAWLSDRTDLDIMLPTEAWWERAARGGLPDAAYPWGDDPLQDEEQTPANGFGVYAVGFNLWEWTADWYSPTYYSISPVVDPRGPDQGDYRVLRGGGYRNDRASAKVFNRGSARPDTSSATITFRIAQRIAPDPPQLSSAKPPAATPSAATTAAPAATAAPPKSVKALAPGSIAVGAVSFEASGGAMTVKLATAGAAPFKKIILSNPDRVVVDIPGGDLMNNRKGGQVEVNQNGVRRIRYSQFQLAPPAVRVVIDLEQPLGSKVEADDGELRVRLQ